MQKYTYTYKHIHGYRYRYRYSYSLMYLVSKICENHLVSVEDAKKDQTQTLSLFIYHDLEGNIT